MRAIIRLGLLGLMLLSSASARISSSPIAELIARSDEIVIASAGWVCDTSGAIKDETGCSSWGMRTVACTTSRWRGMDGCRSGKWTARRM
jgi:hypothetical protein